MRIGRHLSTGPGARQTFERARTIGCDTLQIFVTNPKGWAPPAQNPALEESFTAAVKEFAMPLVVHAAYLINLPSAKDYVGANSITLLRATLERASRFGASYVVVHTGSHTGLGDELGLERLIAGVRASLEGAPEDVTLLLENDTGGGGKLGHSFEHLARVLDAVGQPASRLGVCLDTAHLWGAGVDIGTDEGVVSLMGELNRTFGADRVPVLHLNDSKALLASHRDLHERLDEGNIPREGLRAILRQPAFAGALTLLETPFYETAPDQIDWAAEGAQIARAREMAGLPDAVPDALPDAG
ncbi:MAG TPA: deoxyribonuclease IV [Ktedonobacterales bacterium]